MNNWTTATGRLIYEPNRPDLRKSRKSDDWWLIVETNPNIASYYCWWVEKKWGLKLQLPAWKAHITVLDGRKPVDPKYRDRWNAHKGKVITFEYSVEFEQHWKFFVLPVRCDQLNQLREELGFAPIDNFHITIGRMG
jgi:hypothetical protein